MDKILIQVGKKYLIEMGFNKEASDDKYVIRFLENIKRQEGMEYFQKMAGTTWDSLRNIWKSYHGGMNNVWDALGIDKNKTDLRERLSGMIGLGLPMAGIMAATTPRFSNQSGFGRGIAGLGLGGLAGYFTPSLARQYLKPILNK